MGDDVILGGNFLTAGSIEANRIVKWNKSTNTWTGLGQGLNNAANAVAVSGNDIFAAGLFTSAGGNSANHIARWDGNNWIALGDGFDFPANGIAIDGGNLYACGVFSKAGGVTVNGVAKWDGNSWSALGSGITSPTLGFSNVKAIAIDSHHHVYIGGSFKSVDGVSASNIARWDGSQWTALGSGVNGFVHAIVIDGDQVYIGGAFTTAGGSSASRIAVWNMTSGLWSEVGSGVDDVVFTLTVNENNLYAGGAFTNAGGVSANRIARWDGNEWHGFGTGLDDVVTTITVNGMDVFVGGQFMTAGGKLSFKFAHWTGTSTLVEHSDQRPHRFTLDQNYPNPFNPRTTIAYSIPQSGFVELKIYNTLGREIQTLVNEFRQAGSNSFDFDASQLSNGVYFYQLKVGNRFSETKKMLYIK